MDARKDSGANNSEEGHGLGGAVDGGPPFLTAKMKNRGNQSTGVANTNPEDKVRNIPRPAHRDIVSPDSYSGVQQVKDTENPKAGHGAGNGNRNPPPAWRLVLHDSGN